MNWRAYAAMAAVVVVIWLVGTWATKYSLERMAVLTPVAVVALGALAGVILLWVKVVRDSLRGGEREAPSPSEPGRREA